VIVAASELRDRTDAEERVRTTVALLRRGDEARVLLELENTTTLSIALGRDLALLALQRGDGRRDAIVLDLDPKAEISAVEPEGPAG
jgi:hypothetical protein